MLFWQILIDGFAISALYALGATGFTLIFGVTGVLNLSHGAIMVAAAVAAATDRFGRIDVLVNNAGVAGASTAINCEEDEWRWTFDVNVNASWFVSRRAAQAMIKAGTGGSIINIASMLSFQGGIRVPSYTASKSGVAGLTKLLACEWAAKGVNVNAIAPGYIATNNTAALQGDETRNRQIVERIPEGRWGSPEDIGGAAVFLASSAADYVQGHTLAVDGGWLAR